MKILVLIACLLIERYLHIGSLLRRFSWLERYIVKVEDKLRSKKFFKGFRAIGTIVLPIMAIVALLATIITHFQIGLSGLGLYFIVILYCFGPSDLYSQLQIYFTSSEEGNKEHFLYEYKELTGEEMSSDEKIATRKLTEIIFMKSNCCIFGVAFWFVVFGPLAALFYRLVSLLAYMTNQGKDICEPFALEIIRLNGWINWLPARVMAFFYVVASGFQSLDKWYTNFWSGTSNNNTILVECGLNSLLYEKELSSIEENKKAVSLVDRALVVFIVIILLFALGGWIG